MKHPENIRTLRTKKLEVELGAVERTRLIEQVKAQVTSEVLSETDGAGKKIYSNDATRKAAIEVALTQWTDFQGAVSSLQDANLEVKKIDIDLEYEYNMLKIHLAKNCPFAH